MRALESSFSKIIGRAPTKTELDNIYRIHDALGIRENDALWTVLLALESYKVSFAAVPQKIEVATKNIVLDLHAEVSELAKQSIERTKADLSEVVASSARELATSVAKQTQRKALFFAVSASVLSLSFSAYFGYKGGDSVGVSRGYLEARSESAAATWGATPDGRLAFGLAEAGSLRDLATCSRPGWETRSGACFVRPDTEGNIYGWRLP